MNCFTQMSLQNPQRLNFCGNLSPRTTMVFENSVYDVIEMITLPDFLGVSQFSVEKNMSKKQELFQFILKLNNKTRSFGVFRFTFTNSVTLPSCTLSFAKTNRFNRLWHIEIFRYLTAACRAKTFNLILNRIINLI